MLKKFPGVGDSSLNNLTDGTANNKIRVVKKGVSSSKRPERPTQNVPFPTVSSESSQPCHCWGSRISSQQPAGDTRFPWVQAPSRAFSGEGGEGDWCYKSNNNRTHCERRSLWQRFKGWFRGSCICGRQEQRCNKKLTAWRFFRKDIFGGVPVAMVTPDTERVPSLHPVSFSEGKNCHHFLPHDSAPPPPYSLGVYNDSAFSSGIGEESSRYSMETNGSRQEYDGSRETPWCKILYWEGNERKGKVYPVLDSTINVLGDTPHGSGLSLAAFFGGPPRDDRIRKTRRKICQGLVLWREGKVVWVYNRSEAPVYLNSASLDGSFFNLNLYKCPPGYAMIIYYYEMAHALMGLPDYKNKCLDKADVNSVRISFAKGWGKNYHRREILCCPCWIEVHVVPTLKVEQMIPPR